MNRLTRLTSILMQLQSKRIVKAQEMADRFDISLRTIYRDIKTLQEAGVPIGSTNGVGYFIVDGYRLPPVTLSEEEANALIITEQLVLNQGDQSLIRDFQSLLFKVKAILKYDQKEKLARLQDRVTPSVFKAYEQSDWLSQIQKAITATQVLHIEYHSASKDETTGRDIEPLAISFTDSAWYLLAYCRLRKEVREFRLNRIQKLQFTGEEFQFDPQFKSKAFYQSHQR